MNNLPVWLPKVFAKFYNTLFIGGVQAPQEPAQNLIAGSGMAIAYADNPAMSRTDVTLTATPDGSLTPLHWTSANTGQRITISVPGTLQRVFLDTSLGACSLTLPALGGVADGQAIEIRDDATSGGSWANYPPVLVGSGEDEIELVSPNPVFSFSNTATATPQNGGVWTLIANPAKNRWHST